MRTIVLFPLTLVAVIAGCGSEVSQQATRSVPERDLTLVTHTSEVKIASPVETQQLRAQRRAVRPSPQAARPPAVPRSSRLEPEVTLAAVVAAPALTAAQPVAQPAGTEATPDGRELPPGKTVTLIPASSGPSPGPDRADDLPAAPGRTMVIGGGGTCRGRGRGPGIGIAAAPRPDFR
jgi:hypothetical protein